MAEHTMLSWNFPNWITVVLMVAVGYLVIGLAVQLVKSRTGGASQQRTTAGPIASISDFMGAFGTALAPAR